MKKNGFTLIEVIVTVVILGILSLIFIPIVKGTLDKNNANMQDQIVESIKSAANLYMNDYKYDFNLACNGTRNITVASLVSAGYLKGSLLDKTNNKTVSDTTNITATLKCDANGKFTKFEYSAFTKSNLIYQ